MTATLEMTVPAGWHLVEPGDGPRSADVASVELTRAVPAAERERWRRTVAGALSEGFAAADGEDVELLSMLVPGGAIGLALPMTVAVLRLGMSTDSAHDANAALAGLVAHDATARLLATDAGPVLRTHVSARLGPAHASRLGLRPQEVPEAESLRVRYLLPPRGRGRWLALVHSIPVVDEVSVEAWLELCDALVVAVRWRREE
ncbi:hypothetical protein [Demequina salsinemoris]|uniref:hypothetical protein n=1 Tax=Demequina salsinemoris TaxID=577470 RepID=UPI0007836EEC|nr:hypothetical protein [Demequina salsinemoris]